VRLSIGADSLAYISLDELVAATTVAPDRLCRACFDGHYPVALPEPELLGKHLLEGLASLVVGGGAEDALSRP
jgi:amidophosphoribosyltransferase